MGFGSSDTESNASAYAETGTGSIATELSSAPSRRGEYAYAGQYMNDCRPPPALPEPGHRLDKLPCEFVGLDACAKVYSVDDEDDWVKHVRGHLKDKFPEQCICWFCDKRFDAKKTCKGDRKANFKKRMHHVRKHFKEKYRMPVNRMIDDIRPDFYMLTHLHKHKLISEAVFQRAKSYQEGPVAPPGYQPDERLYAEQREDEVYYDQEQEDRMIRKEKKKKKHYK